MKWGSVLCVWLLVLPVGAAQQVFQPVWRIGLDADMSANGAQVGEAIRRGAQIAIDEINAGGGLLGRPLLLDVRDHRGNPARGKANLQSLSKFDDLLAVIGGKHSPVMLYELETIAEKGLLTFSPWAAANAITDNQLQPNTVFRVSLRDEHAASILLEDIAKAGHKRVALLLENTGWGRSNEQAMRKAAERLQIEVVAVDWFNWNQSNMEGQLNRLWRANPAALVMVANVGEGVNIVRSLQKLGSMQDLPLWSHWGIIGDTFVEELGLELLSRSQIRVIQSFSFALQQQHPKRKKLFEAYRQAYAPAATVYDTSAAAGVAHAYDSVHLLYQAASACRCTDAGKLTSALENIEEYQGVVKTYRWPFRDGERDALTLDDYHIATFDAQGRLVPIPAS